MNSLIVEPRPRKRRRIGPPLLALLFLSAALVAGYRLWNDQPNREHLPPDFGGFSKPIFYEGELLKPEALGTGATLALPLPVIQEHIDPYIRYEADSKSVIITTADRVLRMKTRELTAFLNEKPISLQVPVEEENGVIYVPVQALKDYYRFQLSESSDTGAVLLKKEGDALQWAKVVVDSKHPTRTKSLRSLPSSKAPIYTDLSGNQSVMLWGEEDGWYRAQTESGIIGYVRKADLVLDRTETVPIQPAETGFDPGKPLGEKINLTWQQIWSTKPDLSKIGDMPGLNVISPQWLHLLDGEGTVTTKADLAYSKWAHERNYRIWALFNNGFDPDRTTQALASYDTRMKIIKQLVAYAQMYDMQGINVDFENVYLKDKENFVQFLREMTPIMHEQGLIVSVDITVKGGSEVYSKFLDRRALGETVDYLILMGYDEHWATSQTAGSVASLPWVEEGVSRILEEDDVPPDKFILGVPFYTRIWTEETVDGKMKVSSKAYSMDYIQSLIKEKKLTPVMNEEIGQHYVEYKEDGKTMKIWIEDAISMQKRMDLVAKYKLGGVASWSRGMESADIWKVIQNSLKVKP
ncbi:glycosyl hydrolase family 18 protein [Gorillibacterium timonense]|uniref:glycosyl hydrolase family 18 protein n=1 Tax=Gorillibacterium timonense TaxID=1689269 RepID=UPI00071D0D35|nr:glycosyl hydrolase family 18 protein [Gorillibacterium timonense]